MDPFEEESTPEVAPDPTPPKKPRKLTGTRKVTYAAAATAIGTLCSVIAVYLPIKVMPLVATAFCFFVIFDRCGAVFGFVTEAAVLLMTFFVGGVALSATFVILAVVFVPYAPIAFLLRKLTYAKWRQALLRGGAVAVFVNLAFLAVYYILQYAVLGGGLDLTALAETVGGYWVIALLLVPLSVSVDYLFTQVEKLVDKLLK